MILHCITLHLPGTALFWLSAATVLIATLSERLTGAIEGAAVQVRCVTKKKKRRCRRRRRRRSSETRVVVLVLVSFRTDGDTTMNNRVLMRES